MEAVLDFGRGRQKWLKSCNGECVGGGEGGVWKDAAAAYVIASGWGGGRRGGVEAALQMFALHICSPLSRSSFSFLYPAVEPSFDIIKALWEAVQ